jgi:hypothetical protein
MAFEHARATGEVVVFYRFSEYDFTTIAQFYGDGKTEVAYIV